MTRIWTQRVASDDEYTEARARDMKSLQGIRLRMPDAVAAAWPNVTLDVTSDHPPGDSFKSGPMLVVSERLANLLREIVPQADFELLPVRVAFGDTSYSGYSVLHILRRVNALDQTQAQFSVRNGLIDSIEKISIDEKMVCDAELFELPSVEWVVCVSDRLAARIERSGISGVALESPEQWTPF